MNSDVDGEFIHFAIVNMCEQLSTGNAIGLHGAAAVCQPGSIDQHRDGFHVEVPPPRCHANSDGAMRRRVEAVHACDRSTHRKAGRGAPADA